MKTNYRKYQCLLPRTTLTRTVVAHVTYTAREDAGSLVVRVYERKRPAGPRFYPARFYGDADSERGWTLPNPTQRSRILTQDLRVPSGHLASGEVEQRAALLSARFKTCGAASPQMSRP